MQTNSPTSKPALLTWSVWWLQVNVIPQTFILEIQNLSVLCSKQFYLLRHLPLPTHGLCLCRLQLCLYRISNEIERLYAC